MADGTVQQVSTLRRGDTVTGITRVKRYNRFVETTVESLRVGSSPMYRVEATATALIAASAQLVLTDRGWKHILGTGTGANQRPYLTRNNRLLGFTALNGPPVVTPAYRRGYLTGMIRGDGTIGTYTYRRRAGTAV